MQIHQYVGGLLHSKSMTIDDDVTLIGSANMHRRSFETSLARSNVLTLEDVEAWSISRQLWNNAIAMLGPVL